jgi:hypothetical protein
MKFFLFVFDPYAGRYPNQVGIVSFFSFPHTYTGIDAARLWKISRQHHGFLAVLSPTSSDVLVSFFRIILNYLNPAATSFFSKNACIHSINCLNRDLGRDGASSSGEP